MNIRSAIEEVLYYAGDATLLPCVPVQLEHALSALRAWLDAQDAATERWEPVEYLDPMPVVTITPHYDNHAYLVTIRRGNIITLHHGTGVVGSAT